MKKILLLLGSIFLIILTAFFIYNKTIETNNQKAPKEYLHIVTTKYNNGENDDDGVSTVLYLYSVEDKKILSSTELSEVALYPVAFQDLKNEKIYFSGSDNRLYDNLYEYDLKTGAKKQLTNDKILFNDMFMVNGNLYVTAAPEYKTVTQPAVFDFKTNQFKYYNEDDDDTWFHSFSYNYTTGKLLCLTTSDSEMRSQRVTEVTHIRPKKIFLMDLDFKNPQYVFETEDFEIRLTRQLNENRILMATDPFMGASEPRTLKILYIDSQKVEDFKIPGIKEVYSFYPRYNGKGLFILGRDEENNFGLYYYDMINNNLNNIFEGYTFPRDYRSLVDFVYSVN